MEQTFFFIPGKVQQVPLDSQTKQVYALSGGLGDIRGRDKRRNGG